MIVSFRPSVAYQLRQRTGRDVGRLFRTGAGDSAFPCTALFLGTLVLGESASGTFALGSGMSSIGASLEHFCAAGPGLEMIGKEMYICTE